uniref:DUF7758 domain-containing protein n=1 Tax=Setaria digitata TaxID=48799 RepID=A0A915Q0B1_9BILA
MMNSTNRISKIRAFHKKLARGWKKARCTLCGLYFRRFRKCEIPMKQCLCSPLFCIIPEAKKICCLKLKSSSDSVKPIKHVVSKLSGKSTSELERMKRKGDNWSANDLFKFQHGNLDHCNMTERREVCLEWLRRLSSIPKKYYYLAWYASAIYTCYYRLAPLITDKEEKKRIWIDVKREYAEIFLMGRRIWRRPTHPTRLRILYDLAMLCVLFNDVPNDQTIVLFRDLLNDNDNFNFEVLDEIEYAQSIDKAVRLENHVIDLFYQRRKSTCSARSSFLSKSSTETPRSSFRSLKVRNDDIKSSKLSKASSLSIPDNMMSNSSMTTGILPSRSPQVTRKLSVRFAGRPKFDRNNETETIEGNLNSINLIKMNSSENNTKDNDGKLKIIVMNATNDQQMYQMESEQFTTSNIIVNEIDKLDKNFIITKRSSYAETIRTLPLTVSDQIMAFIALCQNV